MKIINPLHYPVAIAIAGICLVLGVRIIKLPKILMFPISGAIAIGGSTFLATKQPEKINLKNPALENELKNAQQQAQLLIKKAENLRLEAEKLLQDSWQIELLSTVQYTCDRTLEIPKKIEIISQKLHGGDSLLSIEDLQKQLKDVNKKQKDSRGRALEQLRQLEKSLRNNIQLAKEGQDAREAQVFSLVNVIIESAGVLQKLQNKLRTADLTNSEQIKELQSLSEELNNFQDNFDLLV